MSLEVKAIIFDMDGTIINTEAAWKQAKVEALEGLGVASLNKEQHDFLESLVGASSKDYSRKIKDFFDLAHPAEAIITNTNRFFLQKQIDFIDGFEEFHLMLQTRNIPTAMATNTLLDDLANFVGRLNLERFFGKHIYSIAHVDNKPKPDPAVFLHAAEKLGVKPEECMVFEDSCLGIQAAKAAGMRCVAIKYSYNQHLASELHAIITNYHEAEDVLTRTQKERSRA